jgi:hypothetical protein
MRGARSSTRYRKGEPVMKPTETLTHWLHLVTAAALTFEARWSWRALRRLDADLAANLTEQRNLFDAACVTGTPRDIAEHGAAMVRGYAVAVRAMEAAEEPDDAYQIGVCPETGVKVAVGTQKAAVHRIRELYGPGVPLLSPDEVAALVGLGADTMNFAVKVKQLFPGAELGEIRKSIQ